jgi:hypothetical protein
VGWAGVNPVRRPAQACGRRVASREGRGRVQATAVFTTGNRHRMAALPRAHAVPDHPFARDPLLPPVSRRLPAACTSTPPAGGEARHGRRCRRGRARRTA